MLEALNHTLRRRILRSFGSKEEQVGAADLAHALDAPISEVSYHIAFLVKSRALETGDIENARGASRRFYCLSPNGKAEWVRDVLEASRDDDGG
jgi:DNA-binding transcriptional ArsR family regulator